MLGKLRASIIVTILVSLSAGPFSWSHTHAGLDAQQLEDHLRVHHWGSPWSELRSSDTLGGVAEADLASPNLPCDWHSHLVWIHASCPGQLSGGTATHLEGHSVDQHLDWLCDATIFTAQFVDPSADRHLGQQPSLAGPALGANADRNRETFQRLGVLLI